MMFQIGNRVVHVPTNQSGVVTDVGQGWVTWKPRDYVGNGRETCPPSELAADQDAPPVASDDE